MSCEGIIAGCIVKGYLHRDEFLAFLEHSVVYLHCVSDEKFPDVFFQNVKYIWASTVSSSYM